MSQLINIVTPDLGHAADVAVIEIAVKVGDDIEKDATIVTLESDKATMDVPTSDAGKVKSIAVKVGDKVAAGSVLVVIEAAGDAKRETVAAPKATPAPVTVDIPVAKSIPAPVVVAPVSKQDVVPEQRLDTEDGDVHAGPAVRRFARELGVDLRQVTASGPKGRILKEDIERYVKARLSSASVSAMPFDLPAMPTIDFSVFGPVSSVPLSRIKKISGKNLQRNWVMIPHVTQFGDADITMLESFRQEQKSVLDDKHVKLTPLVFIMKAVVASLKAFPQFNASLDASGENIVMKQYFHIGVAVDTPDGLVVPVIRDVDQKGLVTLAVELAAISDKARKKQLLPKDMQGGCFSISSLGGIGGTAFTPIINAPEVAILGVSQSSHKPVYRDGQFVPRLMLPLSLSYDHRVIDGADGARFMEHLKKMLSDIRQWLL